MQNSLKRRAFERIKFMKIRNKKLLDALKILAIKNRDKLIRYFNIWKNKSQGPNTDCIKGLLILQKLFEGKEKAEKTHFIDKLCQNNNNIKKERKIGLLKLIILLKEKEDKIAIGNAFQNMKGHEAQLSIFTSSDEDSEENRWFELAPKSIALNSVCNKQTVFWRLVLAIKDDDDNNILPDDLNDHPFDS